MPMDGGIFVVSPYLSRPLRSLREAIDSHGAVPERESVRNGTRPDAGPIGPAGPNSEPPAEADPMAPRHATTVVTGGA